MAVDKKRPLEDAEATEPKVVKKAKSDATEDEAALKAEKKQRKKEKREKKQRREQEKKEKKDKKSKAKKDAIENDAELTDKLEATAEPGTEPAIDNEEQESSDKKAKKSKKEKKEKKEKNSKSKDAAADAAAENGTDKDPSSAPESTPSATVMGTYTQTAALAAVPASEIQAFLQTQTITITDPRAPSPGATLRPILKFDQLPTTPLLAKNPFASFAAPTPIQSASWPFALAGRDVIGIAETGSGKTIAFALPCVEKLSRAENNKSAGSSKKGDRTVYARAVVVSPTRELAMQTHAAIASLAAHAGLSAVCLFGGASKDDQRATLRAHRGADIVVATPGRLKDFLAEGCVSLARAQFAVLDEADRMLDKGFEEDVKLILGGCPPREERQTLMFTATWPASVRGLAEGYMVDPVKVTIGRHAQGGEEGGDGSGGIELQANSRIEQKVEVVEPRGKEQRVLALIREAQAAKGAKNNRILVFCLYKKEAVRVEGFLQQRGVRVVSIHGDLSQDKRTASLEAFKSGATSVLVATDVAARGLDIPEVKLVINVTFPLTIEDYVHRIGRTGRAGKTGKAITLFTEHDKAHSGSLINVLKAANQPVPDELLKFGTTVKKKTHDTYGAFFKDVDMSKKGTKITFD